MLKKYAASASSIFLALVFCSVSLAAQQSQATGSSASAPVAIAGASLSIQSPETRALRISGTVLDPAGVPVVGAQVIFHTVDESQPATAQTDDAGKFAFETPLAGPFRLSVSAQGFLPAEIPGTVPANQSLEVPPIRLALPTVNTQVRVVPPDVLAETQIKEEEKQKALGFIPNFYVSYIPDAAPLDPRQKFELAWKTMVDPVSFGIAGAVAGLQQANNNFSGYGQGAQGYGKRYGAAYADFVTSTLIGGAILPSLWKQDPRYFYKGTGSKKSRLAYALANAVICKGDNGKWQPNYSGLTGGLAAGAISNAYYPASDRDWNVTFENWAIGIGATAAANVLQEFVIKKFTPAANRDPSKSSNSNPLKPVARAFGRLVHEGD
jgi:hypothetical protein